MEILKAENLSFTYPKEKKPALSSVSFAVDNGKILLVCGGSGCGKTTLLRQFKKELQMQGERAGKIYFQGRDLQELSHEDSAKEIAYLFQNPDSQIVMETVRGEIAFSLENLGLSNAEMKRRIGEIVAYFGISELLSSPTNAISGGQKQLVNLCALLAQRPTLLLLDEPLSQLDPIARSEFLGIITRINRDFGTTVVIAEHCTEEVLDLADQVLFMEGGHIVLEGTPVEIAQKLYIDYDSPKDFSTDLSIEPSTGTPTGRELTKFRGFFPIATEVAGRLGQVSLTVKDTKKAIDLLYLEQGRRPFLKKQRDLSLNSFAEEVMQAKKELVIEGKDLYFQYTKGSQAILNGLNISLCRGDFVAVLGSNGSGKSTLVQMLAGLYGPIDGALMFEGKNYKKYKHEIHGKIGYVPQNPRLLFTCDTVLEELNLATDRAIASHLESYMSDLFGDGFDFTHLYHRHPYDLSGGETQRLALYCALLKGQTVLLLDEVTKGLDPLAKESISKILKNLAQKGITILMVTHDIEFAASHAEKFTILFDGTITDWQSKEQFFNGNYFYTTALKRIFGDKQKDIIVLEDLELYEENK